MNYELFPKVTESGFVGTGVTALINDRDTSLVVPWEAAHKSEDDTPIRIKWDIKSDDGSTYRVTIPVLVTYDSTADESTAAYTHGTYTIAKIQGDS